LARLANCCRLRIFNLVGSNLSFINHAKDRNRSK
jgi:hypothetical protein